MSDFPTNVVADRCIIKAEIRRHFEEKILEVIKKYKICCGEVIKIMGGGSDSNIFAENAYNSIIIWDEREI